MDCDDAQSLLLAQRRLMQAEDEKRFLRRRRRTLEQELAVLKRTMNSKSPEDDPGKYPTTQPNVHESLFWTLDAHLTCITQVLSSERAMLGELRDLFKRDRSVLEGFELQIGKLHKTADGLNGAIGMLRSVIENAIGRDPDATTDME
ncbi:hypothetical protein B0H13DRAFT_1853655 [Mycena leptocephala]|nr:hypothetical protein B0H13DRAFT_1853655 [Mycena leptocephala]